MKKKNIRWIYFAALFFAVIAFSCKKSFLEVQPAGVLGDEEVATQAGINELLVAAYSDLDGQYNPNGFNWYAQPDNWLYGSVCGGDAHKGSDPGDQALAYAIATFASLPTNDYYETRWEWLYDGISRSNLVLRTLPKVEGLLPADTMNIAAQARFLRGFYAFMARITWKNVPWVDPSVTYGANNYKIPNDQDIYPEIEADFQFAYQNLPSTQDAVGKANKYAAGAFLAKVYMFEQKYDQALPILTDLMTNGKTTNGLKYALLPKFSDNFNFASKNESESVFAIQASLNDGASSYHGNVGDLLNFPYGNGALTGCCGFFQPSIELANSYRTDANGLPLLTGATNTADGAWDTPANAVKNDQGITSDQPFTPDQGNLDPRLDWTVGRRGIQYLDWGVDPGSNWIRNQKSAGPYSPKKNVFYKTEVGTGGDNATTQWAPTTAINYCLIRYADVILWHAECEVEAGNLEIARADVNMVRQRAANPNDFVMNVSTGKPAANYKIGLYTAPWTDKNAAMLAVRFERKLELAMEGHRFFDLVRWGVATATINDYIKYEGQFTGDIKGASFTDKNLYFPIPQQQIDLSGGTLKQN